MTLHLVTGASRGLGAALVRQLLQEGHRVVAAARGPAPADIEGAIRLDWTRLDLADLEAGQDWITRSLAASRPEPTLLVLNAGVVLPVMSVAGLEPTPVEAHLRINLASPMLLSARFLAATDAWQTERRILAISSGAARRGIPFWSAYCASKAGLDGFVRGLNADYADRADVGAMRAVSLAPGVVDTAMQETIRGIPAPQQERFQTLHAAGQLAAPADAAAAILAYARRDDFGTHEIDDIRRVSADDS